MSSCNISLLFLLTLQPLSALTVGSAPVAVASSSRPLPQARVESGLVPFGSAATIALCKFVAETDCVKDRNVLELGCGTGACGLFAAAACGARHVELTDVERADFESSVGRNVRLHRRNVPGSAAVCCNEYDWGDCFFEPEAGLLEVILGADLLSYDRVDDLADTVEHLLAESPGAAAFFTQRQQERIESRDALRARAFQSGLDERGLVVEVVRVDRSVPDAPVEILKVTESADSQLARLLS